MLLFRDKTRRRSIAIVAVSAAVGIACWLGSRRIPTGPDAGTAASGAAASGSARPGRERMGTEASPGAVSAAKRLVSSEPLPILSETRPVLRIGTFNIHSCKGKDGRRDVARVAQCLADLDAAALQEVRAWRWNDPPDQAEAIGRRLGRAWLFAPAETQWFGAEAFGNGLVTSRRVTAWQRIPLVEKGDWSYRNCLLAGLEFHGRTVRLLVTHLARHSDEERRLQLRSVIDLFLSLEEPAVLLGDLNSGPDEPLLGELLATPGVVDAAGPFLPPEARQRVDWIFARGFRAVAGGARDSGASDHPLLWAELELLKSNESVGPIDK